MVSVCSLSRLGLCAFRKFWPVSGTEAPMIRWPGIWYITGDLNTPDGAFAAERVVGRSCWLPSRRAARTHAFHGGSPGGLGGKGPPI